MKRSCKKEGGGRARKPTLLNSTLNQRRNILSRFRFYSLDGVRLERGGSEERVTFIPGNVHNNSNRVHGTFHLQIKSNIKCDARYGAKSD